MTHKIAIVLSSLLLLGCGSSTTDTPTDATSDMTTEDAEKKEHFLSDQQRALESAKTAADAIAEAAARNAEATEKLKEKN